MNNVLLKSRQYHESYGITIFRLVHDDNHYQSCFLHPSTTFELIVKFIENMAPDAALPVIPGNLADANSGSGSPGQGQVGRPEQDQQSSSQSGVQTPQQDQPMGQRPSSSQPSSGVATKGIDKRELSLLAKRPDENSDDPPLLTLGRGLAQKCKSQDANHVHIKVFIVLIVRGKCLLFLLF